MQSIDPGGPFVTGLSCRECGRPYPAEALHVCEFCFGPLEVVYDYDAVRAVVSREAIAAGPTTIWRYAPLLPVEARDPVNLGAGFTPLVRAERLAAELGLGELWVKNDTLNPTGSFKDRVVSVALTKARELGFKVAACASTGNLANSVAAHAA
ncbi:MAG: threonine synthase, partial [Acidimicrobiales bacterium]